MFGTSTWSCAMLVGLWDQPSHWTILVWYPQSDSNWHCVDFKSTISTCWITRALVLPLGFEPRLNCFWGNYLYRWIREASWYRKRDSNPQTIVSKTMLYSSPAFRHGGQRRTRTSELRRELIYSQWPLPLGYLPIVWWLRLLSNQLLRFFRPSLYHISYLTMFGTPRQIRTAITIL